jgi:hypothetical protein
MIVCESFDCVGSFEEDPCEEVATQFFLLNGFDGEQAIGTCNRHAHIYCNDSVPISEQMYAIFKIHED